MPIIRAASGNVGQRIRHHAGKELRKSRVSEKPGIGLTWQPRQHFGGTVKYSPQTANTLTQICSLKTDNYGVKGYWIIINGPSVTLAKQEHGEPAEVMLTMPKRVFDAFIKWYVTPSSSK